VATLSKQIYDLHKVNWKQIYDVHMLTHHVQFFHLPLEALPIVLSYTGAFTVENSWNCNCVTGYVSEILHPSICYLTLEDSLTRLKWRHVALLSSGFLYEFSLKNGRYHSPYMLLLILLGQLKLHCDPLAFNIQDS
jgi:hypothetical protein